MGICRVLWIWVFTSRATRQLQRERMSHCLNWSGRFNVVYHINLVSSCSLRAGYKSIQRTLDSTNKSNQCVWIWSGCQIKVCCAHERSVVFSANLHSAQFLIRRKRSWRDGFDAVLFQSSAKKEKYRKMQALLQHWHVFALCLVSLPSQLHTHISRSLMNLDFLFGSLPALLDQYVFLAASSVQLFVLV